MNSINNDPSKMVLVEKIISPQIQYEQFPSLNGISNNTQNQESTFRNLVAMTDCKMGFFQRISEKIKGNLISIKGDGLCFFRSSSLWAPIVVFMNEGMDVAL